MSTFFPPKHDKQGWMACIIGFVAGLLGMGAIAVDFIIKLLN